MTTKKSKPANKSKRRYLTPKKLAKRWKVSVKTLANQRCNGTGPAYLKISEGKGGRIRYLLKSVKEYEAAHTASSTFEFRSNVKAARKAKKKD